MTISFSIKKIISVMPAVMVALLVASCRETADDSYEGGRVVFFDSAGTDIYSVDSKGGVYAGITANDSVSTIAPALSNSFAKSAGFVAYASTVSISYLCLYDLETSTDHHPFYDTGDTVRKISVSPDQRYMGVTTYSGIAQYIVVPRDGGAAAAISSSLNDYSVISWSPDSRHAAYISDQNGSGNIEVRINTTDGGAERQLTEAGGLSIPREPQWSPRGDRILYTDDITGARNLYSVRTDGTGLLAHTTGAVSCEQPCWSPDGSRIAYLDNNMVYVTETDGTSSPRPVFGDYLPGGVSWSFYGTRLLVTAEHEDADIFSVDPDTGEYFILAGGTGLQMYPVWIPD